MLLPTPPRPHHMPLPPPGRGPRRINDRRDLVQEIDDLSDEENELDDMRNEIKNRGSSWLIPIGKQLTLQEEKNDASSSSSSEAGTASNGPASNADDAENESAPDLDASMADVDDADGNEEGGDDTGDITGDMIGDMTDEQDTGQGANLSIESMQE